MSEAIRSAADLYQEKFFANLEQTLAANKKELASVKAENEKLRADFNDVYEGSKAYFIKVTQLKLTNAALTEKLSLAREALEATIYDAERLQQGEYAVEQVKIALQKLSPDQDDE